MNSVSYEQATEQGFSMATQVQESRPGTDGQQVGREFEFAMEDIRTTMTQVSARLLGLVQQEVRNMFEDAMNSAGSPLPSRVHKVERHEAPEPTFHSHTQPASNDNPRPDAGEVVREPLDWLDLSGTKLAQPSPGSSAQLESKDPEEETQPAVSVSVPSDIRETKDDQFNIGNLPDAPTDSTDGEVYEGTVRLNVIASGCSRQVLHFVNALCQTPQFRLLQLVGNHRREGVDIWLGLRAPTGLRETLLRMEGVSHVNAPLGHSPHGNERLVEVWLA